VTTVNIALSDDSFSKLNDLADKTGLAPAEFLRRRVEQMLSQPDEEFLRGAQRLLEKNAELYRRLA
jgi:predicted DNA-binding protein